MKTGRPGSMPQRPCCSAGDMIVEESLRIIEMKLSRNGIIEHDRTEAASSELLRAISELEQTVVADSPRAVAVRAMLNRACLERLKRAQTVASRATAANIAIAMEELRFAARPPAFAEFPELNAMEFKEIKKVCHPQPVAGASANTIERNPESIPPTTEAYKGSGL